jgi:adenosylmethionine-8-amino-7-oxononanoate aminotransferase
MDHDSDSRSETTSSQGKSAFGGISGDTATQERINYNTPAVALGNQVSDGDEFILIKRSYQGDGFQAWSSGDSEVTQQLMQQASKQLDFQPA